MVPSGSEEAAPLRPVELVGNVMTLFAPAFATGALFVAGLTVTVTVAEEDALSLSLTVSL